MTIQEILKILSIARLPVSTEKECQAAIQEILEKKNIWFRREWRIGEKDIPDFFISGGIVMEVKIKGRPLEIYKQCERYMKYDAATSLILITNKAIGFPKELNGKPCYVINMGKSWL